MSTPSAAPASTAVSNLMPPPPRPSQASSLRIPSNGPLPNRLPPARASNSLLPPSSKPSSVPNPRKKIILEPGHSPLDWAALQSSGENLAGVTGLQRVTPRMLMEHNGRKGQAAWAAWQGKVYNITPYLPFHPGGKGELLRAAGKGGDVVRKLFDDVHPWVNWENMLGSCLVGFMVGEGEEENELEMVD